MTGEMFEAGGKVLLVAGLTLELFLN